MGTSQISTITVTLKPDKGNERDCYAIGADGKAVVIYRQERSTFFSCFNNPEEIESRDLSDAEIGEWWDGSVIEVVLSLKDWAFYLEGFELVFDPDETAVQAYLESA